jgi:hypothetical protein
MAPQKVRFQGQELVLIEMGGTVGLAYPHQVNEDGYPKTEVMLASLYGDASADPFGSVTSEGNVMRYGKVVGTREEFEMLGGFESAEPAVKEAA